jgi:hypothetical protein
MHIIVCVTKKGAAMPTALPQSLGGVLKGGGGASTAVPTAAPTAVGGVSPTAAAGGKSPVGGAKSLLSPPVRSVLSVNGCLCANGRRCEQYRFECGSLCNGSVYHSGISYS